MSLQQLQELLSQESILVGHSLELLVASILVKSNRELCNVSSGLDKLRSDLKALQLVHERVIDTAPGHFHLRHMNTETSNDQSGRNAGPEVSLATEMAEQAKPKRFKVLLYPHPRGWPCRQSLAGSH